MNVENQSRSRWIIGTIISLLAAGGGIVALLTFLSGPKQGNNYIPPNNSATQISKPIITRFESIPQQISQSMGTTLNWKVENANIVEIEPGIGKVALVGNRELKLSSTTTYTLTAQNDGGITTATFTIIVSPSKKLYMRAVTSPPSVAAGEKATIYVTVADENNQVIPGAFVLINAGGGKFLERENMIYNPNGRLHGPFSVSGQTDSRGVYTGWWVCKPCAQAYVLSVEATKDGYIEASGEVTINIR